MIGFLINLKDIISISVTDDWQLQILVNVIVLIGAIVLGIVIFKLFTRSWQWGATKVEINFPFSAGKVEIQPDQDTKRIAHQAWAEIVTRKAGISFDVEHDTISEIYDSWYALFKEIRSLVKSIPANKLKKSEDVQKLVTVLISVLNEGLRPHLTKWHSRFRRWYDKQLEECRGDCPQDIQKKFPDYDKLIADLETVNTKMVEFAASLREIIDS